MELGERFSLKKKILWDTARWSRQEALAGTVNVQPAKGPLCAVQWGDLTESGSGTWSLTVREVRSRQARRQSGHAWKQPWSLCALSELSVIGSWLAKVRIGTSGRSQRACAATIAPLTTNGRWPFLANTVVKVPTGGRDCDHCRSRHRLPRPLVSKG